MKMRKNIKMLKIYFISLNPTMKKNLIKLF